MPIPRSKDLLERETFCVLEIAVMLGNDQEVIKATRRQSWRIVEEHGQDGCVLNAVNNRYKLYWG